jgi:hypothetical protein
MGCAIKPKVSACLPLLQLYLLAACASPPGPALALEVSPPAAEEDDPAPMRPPRALDEEGVFYVLGAKPGFPRVRYLDGQVALNESCAIRVENKLNRRIPPVYVNGQPIGFC